MSFSAVGNATAVRQASRRAADLGWPVVVATLIIVALVIAAAAAPLIAPHDPDAVDLSNALAGASGAHPLGTDESGRDILSRMLWGARISLAGPLVIVLIATAVGSIIALVAAWFGGLFDRTIATAIDIALAFPGLLLAILAVAFFGSGFLAPVIGLTIAYIPYIARLVRSAALAERSLPYVAALGIQGFGGFVVMVRHVLPNIAPLILAQATLTFAFAMVDLAAISFIGLGTQPPTADWGTMISAGQASVLRGSPEQSIFAGAAVVLAVVALNIIGEAGAARGSRSER